MNGNVVSTSPSPAPASASPVSASASSVSPASASPVSPKLPSVGSIIRFLYEGGSKPGTIRIVKVTKVVERQKSFYIEGTDLTYNEPQYRQYAIGKIKNFSELKTETK